MILFSPFTSLLDSHLIISLIVVLLGWALRGRCIFFYFYESHFPSAFSLLPFSVLTFSTFLIVDEGGRRDLHN